MAITDLKFDGSKLRARRESLKKTQTEVADYLEITPQSYGEMERGQISPSSLNLTKLCILFDCAAQDFFIVPSKIVANV